MSIKPIDFKITIPKLQEMSKIYQTENNKPRNDAYILETQQRKKITCESKKVIDTKKTNNSRINNGEEKHNKSMQHNEDKDTKEHINKKEHKGKNNLNNNDIGKKIDIKV